MGATQRCGTQHGLGGTVWAEGRSPRAPTLTTSPPGACLLSLAKCRQYRAADCIDYTLYACLAPCKQFGCRAPSCKLLTANFGRMPAALPTQFRNKYPTAASFHYNFWRMINPDQGFRKQLSQEEEQEVVRLALRVGGCRRVGG